MPTEASKQGRTPFQRFIKKNTRLTAEPGKGLYNLSFSLNERAVIETNLKNLFIKDKKLNVVPLSDTPIPEVFTVTALQN